MSRFLHILYVFAVILFVGNAFAAGYTCDSYKQYESCNVGYYMVGTASSSAYDGTPKAGNACKACNGTYCPGGTAAPLYKVTLNVNGGTAGSVTAIYASKSAGWYTGTTSSSTGTKITSLTTAQLPTRSGRRFTGFWTATSGGTQWIDENGNFVSSTSYANVSGAMTLYAQWYDGCLAGEYKDGSTCKSCPDPVTYAPTSFPANYYSPTVESASIESGAGLTSVSQCYALYWYASSSRGKFYDYSYYSTSTGRYAPSGVIGWYSVKPGYYLKDQGSCAAYDYFLTVETCPAGSYCPGGTATTCTDSATFGLNSCASNSSSAAGSDAISDCSCNAGYSGNAGTSGGTCTACAKGAYKGSAGNTTCTTCTAGKACTTTALTAPNATCTAGYYCPAGSTSATQNQCTANSSSAAGSDVISDCSCNAGYSGNAGTSGGTCTACSCGYYKGSAGNTSCTKTSAGYYAAGTANTTQTQATGGNYAAAGACSQTACAAPYSSSASGSDDTNDCYLTTTSTKYVAEAGKGEVTCAAGGYRPGGSTIYRGGSVSGRATTGGRTLCGAGTANANTGSSASSACVGCAQGSYASGTGNTACTPCQSGKTTSGSGKTSCDTTCTNDSDYDNAWATASWSSDNKVTNLCKISNCKKGSKYSSATVQGYTGSCTACSDNTYMESDAHTNTACSACPTSHPYSTKGSTAISACYTNCTKTSITNGTVSAINSTEKYGTSCSYTVTCSLGYTAAASPSTNPTCNANCVKVTLDSGDANQDGTLYTRYNDKTSWYSDTSCSTKITNITIPTYSGWTFAGYYSTSSSPLKYTADGTLPATTYRGVAYNSSLITATPGSYATPTTWYARWAQNCKSSATATCSGPYYTNASLKISYVNCCLVGYHNSDYANTDDADSYGVCK